MFTNVARADSEAPTEYELFRLRKNEFVDRINKFILETFDTITNLAFVLVLFNQGGVIDLENSWYIISYRTCGSTTHVTSPEVMQFLFRLAIAAAIFFFIKISLRAIVVLAQIKNHHKRIRRGVRPLLLLFAGFWLTVLDPWNGTVLVEYQFLAPEHDVDEYKKAMLELRSDWVLLCMETTPQFIIQVIYAVIAANTASLGLPPAWYVSTATTLLHLISQLHETVYLQLSMPQIKQWAGKLSSTVVPMAHRVSVMASNTAMLPLQMAQSHLPNKHVD